MSTRALLSNNLGSHVYASGAIALGLIGLAWGDFAAVWQPVQPGVPHRTALAYITAICFLAAGVALQRHRTVSTGAAMLIVPYFLSALLWLPRVIGFPRIIGTWSGFAEQIALVAAGFITYSSRAPNRPLWSVRAIRVSRFFFGVCVAILGLSHFLALPQTASMVPAWIPPSQRFWAMATGLAHLLAAIAILSGILAHLASRLLTAMIIGFGALVWAPALFAQPREHLVWAGNAINLALVGAAWMVADSIRPIHLRHREPATTNPT